MADPNTTNTRIPAGSKIPYESTRPPSTTPPRRKRDPFAIDLDAETADLLVRIYLKRRLNYQTDFYEERILQFSNRADLIFKIGAVIMTISTVLSALGTGVGDNAAVAAGIAMLTALLPAFVTFLNAFTQLYQWDRVAALYKDTVLNLEEVRLIIPDQDRWTQTTALDIYTRLISETEKVFEKEADSWGQLAQGKKADGTEFDPVQDFIDQYGTALMDADGNIDAERVAQLEGILRAADAAYTPPSIRQTGEVRSVDEQKAGAQTADGSATPRELIDEISAAATDPQSPLLASGEMSQITDAVISGHEDEEEDEADELKNPDVGPNDDTEQGG